MKIIRTVLMTFAGVMLLGAAAWAQLPGDAVMPGYRATTEAQTFEGNPFEPIREVKTDAADKAMSEAFMKRLKGYIVQSTGVPLLIIDGKSYKVGDRVPLNGGSAGTTEGEATDATQATETPAPVLGGEMATIISVSPTEAVFRKDDATGFGGETFKIYYNFSRVLDSAGNPAYDVWEPIATGFFITEDGLVVAPLDAVRVGEIGVQTQNGLRKALLMDGDEKSGLALLKVGYKSLPLKIASERPKSAEAVFPVGYLADKKASLKYMEGFAGAEEGKRFKIKPSFDGEFVGSPILNKRGEVIGALVGNTQTLEESAIIDLQSSLFRKHALPESLPQATTRATIEQSIVQILKKK